MSRRNLLVTLPPPFERHCAPVGKFLAEMQGTYSLKLFIDDAPAVPTLHQRLLPFIEEFANL